MPLIVPCIVALNLEAFGMAGYSGEGVVLQHGALIYPCILAGLVRGAHMKMGAFVDRRLEIVYLTAFSRRGTTSRHLNGLSFTRHVKRHRRKPVTCKDTARHSAQYQFRARQSATERQGTLIG